MLDEAIRTALLTRSEFTNAGIQTAEEDGKRDGARAVVAIDNVRRRRVGAGRNEWQSDVRITLEPGTTDPRLEAAKMAVAARSLTQTEVNFNLTLFELTSFDLTPNVEAALLLRGVEQPGRVVTYAAVTTADPETRS